MMETHVNLNFLDSPKDNTSPMMATLFKVYSYHGKNKKLWWECEDMTTNEGISWSLERALAVKNAEKYGYIIANKEKPVIKFYRMER